jgi:hypothetical protein
MSEAPDVTTATIVAVISRPIGYAALLLTMDPQLAPGGLLRPWIALWVYVWLRSGFWDWESSNATMG